MIKEDVNENQPYIKFLELEEHEILDDLDIQSEESLIFQVNCLLNLQIASKDEKNIHFEKELKIQAFKDKELQGFNLSILDM